MATARELTAEDVARYRAAARRRHQAEQGALALREQRAWALARRAAALLRDRFHAQQVVAFGSLVHSGCFTEWSDVDVAARGIQPQNTLQAMEAVMGLDTDVAVHLVDVATCSDSLLSVIEREGVPV